MNPVSALSDCWRERPWWLRLPATLRRRLDLRRRRRQLAALEREQVPFLARVAAGWRAPSVSVGYAKGAAALIVEENGGLLRRRRTRTYPLHPTAAAELGRSLMKAARRGAAAGRER